MSLPRRGPLSHDEVLAVVRKAASVAPAAPPPAPPVGCPCHRCIVNALATLHREFENGVHDAPADALADVMHRHFSQKTLARAARGELPCKEPAR